MERMNTNSGTVDRSEVEKFASDSAQWWDEDGEFAPLHKMNPIRLSYIKDRCTDAFHNTKDFNAQRVLAGRDVLDIGCGGGLLSVPMARMGAEITGIDASKESIKAAKDYVVDKNLNIDYLHTTVEQFAKKDKKYDVVTAMEIVEHVNNPKLFLNTACSLLKPGGIMFISTIARTLKSYSLAILGAEYILRWLPIGTHDWAKFLNHTEIIEMLDGVEVVDVSGMSYNPLLQKWKLSGDLQINYILCIKSNLS